jgi:CRP-like cAMP-binding protein
MYDAGHKSGEMDGFESLRGFRTLPLAERTVIAGAAREQWADKSKMLFAEGRPADYVWAVKSGVVHITKSAADGREVVLEVIPPGELFGAVAVLEGRPYPASAQAAEPSVVWKVPAQLVRDLCHKYPALRASILSQMTERLRSAHDSMRSLALEKVEQRLAKMVLRLADKVGEKRTETVVLNVTRQELADMVGSTVETTIRITSKWLAQGLITSSRHAIGLIDIERLRGIAAGAARRAQGR